MLTKNKNKLLIAALLILFVFVYWLWSAYFRHKSNINDAVKPTIPVTVITAEKKEIELRRSLPGRIMPYEVAELRPQVSGILNERFFEEGAFVKKGEQLYQIDPAPYQAAYNSAVANVAKSKANLQLLILNAKRAEELIKSHTISQQDYDNVMAQYAQAKADVGIAQAALESTKINLEYTKMNAPISGRIGKSELTKGALVTANQANPMARITQLDPIYVDLALPMYDFKILHKSLADANTIHLLLYVDSKKDPYKHPGKIQFTDVTVSETTDSVLIRSIFPNPENSLLPGLFVRADLELKAVDAILIPQRTVIHNPNGSTSVWLIDKHNIASLQPITVSYAIGDQWLVQSGINAGDKIVLAGIQKLKPGVMVKPEVLANPHNTPEAHAPTDNASKPKPQSKPASKPLLKRQEAH